MSDKNAITDFNVGSASDAGTKVESKTALSRRALIRGAAVGSATFAAAGVAMANSLTPTPAPASLNPQGRFAGKSVAITGGNSGIGAATVRAFALEAPPSRSAPAATRSAARSRRRSGIWAATCDGFRRTSATPSRSAVLSRRRSPRGGRIDALFNNAGIFMTPGAVEEIDIENYRDMMATNVDGVFYGMKYALPQMRRQGGGVIVNMASVAAHRGFGATAHYNASKHAVIGLTKAAATTAARDNIRVVSISPLAVDTPMLRESFAYQGFTYQAAAAGFVTPRIMTPHEMAEAVMYLASDAASALNGMDLDVTGGQLA